MAVCAAERADAKDSVVDSLLRLDQLGAAVCLAAQYTFNFQTVGHFHIFVMGNENNNQR